MACLVAFKTMLGYGKVGYKEYEGNEALARIEPWAPARDEWENLNTLIEFRAETNGGVEGHDGHLSLFGFDARGKLIGVLILKADALGDQPEY